MEKYSKLFHFSLFYLDITGEQIYGLDINFVAIMLIICVEQSKNWKKKDEEKLIGIIKLINLINTVNMKKIKEVK